MPPRRSTRASASTSCTRSSSSARRAERAHRKDFFVAKESHYSSKKDRVFVRGIAGKYSLSDELARLRAMPRVVKGKDLLFNDGPPSVSKHFIEPAHGLTHVLHVHLEEYGPGGRTQKHGHVNEAAFYILDGKGYEIHDGIRYDWPAGDGATVPMNSRAQPFNPHPV